MAEHSNSRPLRAPGHAGDDAPLTPLQQWFLGAHPDPRRFTRSLIIDVAPPVDVPAVAAALENLIARHDALRLRFTRTESGWRQRVTDARLQLVHSRGRLLPEALDTQGALDPAGTLETLRRSIDLSRPPLLTAALLPDAGALEAPSRAGSGRARPARLLLVVHGLAADAASWPTLLADLRSAYRAARDGRPPGGRSAPVSFARWARALAGPAPAATPVSGGEAAEWVRVGLDEGYTDRLLHQAGAAYRTRVEDLLICALAHTVARRTGRPRVHLDIAASGRDTTGDGVDLAEAVGCFTTLLPVGLDIPGGESWRELVTSVKEQLRTADPTLSPSIMFAYLGRWDPAPDPDLHADAYGPVTGHTITHDLEVTAAIRGGRLDVTWARTDSPGDRNAAHAFITTLTAIIEHCASPGAGRCTPSDFPLCDLDQAALDRVAGNGRQVEDIYPLTPTQQGMLFHSLLDPAAGLYVERVVHTVTGQPQPRLLGQAWQDVVDRTPALRIAVAHEGLAHPVQVVHSTVRLPVSYDPWPADRRIDLPGPPLMRVNIAALDADTVEVTWDLHHLVLDGWSMRQVVADVLAHYRLRAGQTVAAAPARRPFRHHLEWLGRQDHAEALRFWRRTLEGAALPTPLPYADGRRERLYARGRAQAAINLTDESPRLRSFAAANGLTLSTVVQGAWALILANHSGHGDVTFGATVSGRPAIAGADAMIGMFATTVPVRVRLRPDQPVSTWLAALQAAHHAAQPFHTAPLNRIPATLGLPAGVNLFDSIVVFENYPADGDPAVTSLRAIEVSHYPLALVALGAPLLSLRLLYDPDLFTAATVEATLHRLRLTLNEMAAEPYRELGRLLSRTAERPSAPVPRAVNRPAAAGAASVELRLRQIWGQVLAVSRFGPDDDFFALGGDSIQALQVLTRVMDAFGVDLSPRAPFDHPTITTLAAHICTAMAARDGERIEPVSADGPLPQSYAQRRLWYSHLLAPDSAQYHTGLALRFTCTLDVGQLHRTLESLIVRHEALRTVFGPGAVQRVLPAEPITLPLTDLSGIDSETTLHQLLEASMREPFDPGRRPPVRARLIRLGPQEHVLQLVLHHLVCDGRSLAVLAEELIGGYAVGGSTGHLPPIPVRYADFAAWQRRRLTAPALSEPLAYWRRQLAGLRPVCLPGDRPAPAEHPACLPGDRPDPAEQTTAAAAIHFVFPAPLLAALRRAARDADATVFMAVTAVTKLLLSRHTGRRDIAVGTVVSGRDRVELESVVGCFVETLVLRSTVDARLSFVDLLSRVRDTVLAAFAHPAPFELVVEATRPPRREGGTPFISVMVVLQQNPPPAAPWAGEIPIPVTASPFDLTLEFRETPDGLALAVIYRTGRFSPAAAERLGANLLELTGAVTTAPHEALGKLSILDGPEARDEPEADGAPEQPSIAPRTPAEKLVARHWADLLLRQTFGIRDKFFESGGSSLALLELRDRLEPLCGGRLPMAWLLRHQTVEAMARLIEASPSASDSEPGDIHL